VAKCKVLTDEITNEAVLRRCLLRLAKRLGVEYFCLLRLGYGRIMMQIRTSNEAITLKKLLIVLLGLLLISANAFPVPRRSSSTHSKSASSERKKTVHVKSYKRKGGTVVKAHDRHASGSSTKIYSARSAGKRRSSYSSTVQRDSHGKIKRSEKARRAFMKTHPCPATGKTSGACHGYVVDHVKSLASGGVDDPSNMQWQTVAAAKEKDKWERK
jgi:hypothetical protein